MKNRLRQNFRFRYDLVRFDFREKQNSARTEPPFLLFYFLNTPCRKGGWWGGGFMSKKSPAQTFARIWSICQSISQKVVIRWTHPLLQLQLWIPRYQYQDTNTKIPIPRYQGPCSGRGYHYRNHLRAQTVVYRRYKHDISTDINLLSRSVRGGGDVICVLRSNVFNGLVHWVSEGISL